MRIKKFLIFFLLGLFLTTPLVGLAQFSQQQTYPGVGGQDLVGGSASGSIPSLVKYLFNLAVWVCILVAVLVLILGGVQYVASTGDVGKMTGAKTRIYGSLLGLTILIGAWYVLYIMNPSLVIPHIAYVPLKQGIVFFTKDGYCRFMGYTGMGDSGSCVGTKDNNIDASIINDLVQANQAKFINYSAPDLTEKDAFGPLVFSSCPGKGTIKGVSGSFPEISINTTDARLDFADFDAYTFAFWGKKAQGAKLSFYNKTNYENSNKDTIPLTYDYRGLLKENGDPVFGTYETQNKIKDIIIIKPAAFGGIRNPLRPDTYQNSYIGNITSGVVPVKNVFFYNTANISYLNASNYFTVAVGDKNYNESTGLVNFSQCGDREKGVYLNVIADAKFRANSDYQKTGEIKHPPLSVRITWSSAGVYLLADNGDERYFDASAPDFKDLSISFDQKATTIKIINDIPAREYIDENGDKQTIPAEPHDFLAILHQEDNFSGKLKVYFEQRMYKDKGATYSIKAKNILIPAYSVCGNAVSDTIGNGVYLTSPPRPNTLFTFSEENYKDNSGVTAGKVSDLVFKKGNFYFWNGYWRPNPARNVESLSFNFGHLPMLKFLTNGAIDLTPGGEKVMDNTEVITNPVNDSKYDVKEEDRYGKLDKAPSSVEVFELSQNLGILGECQEIKLCTEKSGKGYCLAYTSENNKTNDANTVYYPMPWYLPVPLPFSNTLMIDEGEVCPDQLLPVFKNNGADKSVEISNNIKSILISPEGKCAVVLIGRMSNQSWWKGLPNIFIKNFSTENKNEVFTSSDYNLEDNEIGQCGSSIGFGRWFNQSCAGAIAVYPIK